MYKREKRKYILSIISTLLFLIFVTCFIYFPKKEIILSSFAFLQNQKNFYMEDLSQGISLNNAIPVSDEIGIQYDPYRFKVVNNSASEITYQIVFKSNDSKMNIQQKDILSNEYLRFSLNCQDDILVEPNTLFENGILYTTTIGAYSEKTFEFRMWLDWNSDNNAMNKIFIGKIEIDKI